jgi:hypothetical protein
MVRVEELVAVLKPRFELYSDADGEKRLRGVVFSSMDLFANNLEHIADNLKKCLPDDAKIEHYQPVPSLPGGCEVVFHSSEWDTLDHNRIFRLYKYGRLPIWDEWDPKEK